MLDTLIKGAKIVDGTGAWFDRIAAEFPLPLFMRFLMGFPPGRDIVRLDPVYGGERRP
jgi:hypothetical protein